ncbi:hypothetical protein LCGC14_1684560 [marine sediment metagenome]|uniref:Uncharacterized protein n=1 Tax=marine sediment metagenome TaxID=412755 RepID=A0A0F9HMS6_9ZZZZ
MEYYTVAEVAKKTALKIEIIRAICQSGFFGRKFSNTWLITDRELDAFHKGKRINQDKLPPLFDTNYVIEEMGVSRSMFFRLLDKGAVVADRFGVRGGQPNLIFTQEQLDEARALTSELRIMGHAVTAVDKYIHRKNDRYYVKDTLNARGEERNYKTIYMARNTARRAYNNPPLFALGQTIPFGDQKIEFLKDVLEGDNLAHIKIGNADILYAVRRIVDYAAEPVAN